MTRLNLKKMGQEAVFFFFVVKRKNIFRQKCFWLLMNMLFQPSHVLLLLFYKKLGKPRLALGYLQQALMVEQNTPNTHLNLSAVYSALGKHQEALHHFVTTQIHWNLY